MIDGLSDGIKANGCFSDMPSVSRGTDSGGHQNARRQHTSLGPNQVKRLRFSVKRQAVWFDSRRDLNGKSSDRGLPEKGKAGGERWGGCGGMHPVT